MLTKIKPYMFLSVFLGLTLSLMANTGNIQGTITDLDTQQPLIGANIVLENTSFGAASDVNGYFQITHVPVGSYSLRADMMGYKSQAKANVRAQSNRQTDINITLEPVVLTGDDIVVTAGYFQRVKDASPSVRSVDYEEIKSDPVGAYDVLSMMQSMPSVVSGADQSNEIIVRGGSPGENLFVMDNLDIPYPVHFPQQGAGGGPVTMVNTDFIEKIDFFAGSFPARYGDKLSSVMDVSLRDGNKESHEKKVSFDMAGFGASFEGPINEKSTYLFSIKRSFLDFVIQQSGLQAIPKYWTFQGKMTYNLSPKEKLSLNYLGGIDGIDISGENSPQNRGAENVAYNSQQHTLGLTYKNLFSTKGYIVSSIAQNYVDIDTDVYRIGEDGTHDTYYKGLNIEEERYFKTDLVYKPSSTLELSGGIKLLSAPNTWDFNWKGQEYTLYGYSLDTTLSPAVPVSEEDFLAYFLNDTNTIAVPLAILGLGESLDSLYSETYNTAAIYAQMSVKPSALLELTLGARAEYNAFLNKSNVSPRINIAYQLFHNVKLNVAAGRYYQAPFYALLIQGGNKSADLDYYHADQVALGAEYFPYEDVRITAEYYSKTFDDMPIQTVLIDSANGSDSLGDYANIGSGRSKGFEFYIQKKFSNNWYGSFSFSHSLSEGVDPRKEETIFYPWDYDYRNVTSVIAGYKIRYMDYAWYNRYKTTMLAQMTSWLPIAPADEYEISVRFRYSGGKPYTPKVYNHNLRRWYTNASMDYNTERMDDYLRLDLMLLQRFYFKTMNLVAFWDIMNILNRDNPWDYVYNEDGSKDIALQYKTFPIGGITLEF
jgi:hypothetical protein